MNLLICEIVNFYKKSGSIRATARHFEISDQKVRKILITAGEYDSPLFKKVNQLHQQGCKVSEIAAVTKLSKSAVHSYLPHSRTIYKNNQSQNAKAIAGWREKRRGVRNAE